MAIKSPYAQAVCGNFKMLVVGTWEKMALGWLWACISLLKHPL